MSFPGAVAHSASFAHALLSPSCCSEVLNSVPELPLLSLQSCTALPCSAFLLPVHELNIYYTV